MSQITTNNILIKPKQTTGTFKIILTFIFGASIIFLAIFSNSYITAQAEIALFTKLRNNHTKILTQDQTDIYPDNNNPYLLIDWNALSNINPDIISWIAIPGTKISYPVVQTDNNAFYLNHSFERKPSETGTLFTHHQNNLNNLDSNTIIYGHNMGRGRSDKFGNLLNYKDTEYANINSSIWFMTKSGNGGWWDIVYIVHINYKTYNYDYQKINFYETCISNNWINTSKELSIFDSGLNITKSDNILTLSTCDRSIYGSDGRLLIMGVLRT